MKLKNTARAPFHNNEQKGKNLINDIREKAQAALASNRPEAALPLLERGLALAPEISHLHLLLSQALAALGRRSRALVHAGLAIKLGPPDPEQAAAWKAGLLRRPASGRGGFAPGAAAGPGAEDQASSPRSFLLKRQGGRRGSAPARQAPGTATFEKAMSARHAGDTAGMGLLLRRYIASRPGPGMPLFLALMGTHAYTAAFRLAETLKSDPRLIPQLRNPFDDLSPALGRAYFKRHADRLSRLRAGAGLEKWKYLYLGFLSSLLCEHDAALRWYDLLEKKCAADDGWMLLGKGRALLVTRDDLRLAAGCFTKALASCGSDWTAACYLAETDLCSGRERRGLARFDEALSAAASSADRAEILAWRGNMLLLRGKYRRAARDLEAALAGGAVFARCWLGAALLMAGEKEKALRALEQAVRTAPQDWEAAVWYGEALRRAGRTGAARRALLRAYDSAHVPCYDWAAVNLMVLECEAGNARAARGYFLETGGSPAGASLARMRASGLRSLRLAKGWRSTLAHQRPRAR